jgi:hypothetical protein
VICARIKKRHATLPAAQGWRRGAAGSIIFGKVSTAGINIKMLATGHNQPDEAPELPEFPELASIPVPSISVKQARRLWIVV